MGRIFKIRILLSILSYTAGLALWTYPRGSEKDLGILLLCVSPCIAMVPAERDRPLRLLNVGAIGLFIGVLVWILDSYSIPPNHPAIAAILWLVILWRYVHRWRARYKVPGEH